MTSLAVVPLALAAIAACISPSLAKVTGKTVTYRDGTTELKGYLASDESLSSIKPVVLLVPDWNGLDDQERGRARKVAEQLGYNGFAVDVFGQGKTGASNAENIRLITPFKKDPKMFNKRLMAAVKYVRSLVYVDGRKVAATGQCFGGTGVLNMARANDDILGVVSFHGGLSPPGRGKLPPYRSGGNRPKVLVLTGYNDPSVPPSQVTAFEAEMDRLGADWELTSYSGTYHSFTVPGSNHTGRAVYSKRADDRSWNRMKSFLEELFQ